MVRLADLCDSDLSRDGAIGLDCHIGTLLLDGPQATYADLPVSVRLGQSVGFGRLGRVGGLGRVGRFWRLGGLGRLGRLRRLGRVGRAPQIQ